MRWALAMVLVVTACTQKPAQRDNPASANRKASTKSESASSNSASAAPSDTGATAAGAANKTGVLPPANASLRYVGTWATSVANCQSKPWHFTRDALSAKDGPRCSFYNVAKAPGGYDVAAQCPTKKPDHTDLIKLRFAESAGAMLVESNAIPPTGLVYCAK